MDPDHRTDFGLGTVAACPSRNLFLCPIDVQLICRQVVKVEVYSNLEDSSAVEFMFNSCEPKCESPAPAATTATTATPAPAPCARSSATGAP